MKCNFDARTEAKFEAKTEHFEGKKNVAMTTVDIVNSKQN